VPTIGRRGGAYTIMEPISVIPVTNTEKVRRALLDAIGRGNAAVPLVKGKRPPPLLPKYAGVKSWSAFARSALNWNIRDTNGAYKIVGHRIHPEGYWVEDQSQKIEFPPGTTLDGVVDRMITVLRDAAHQSNFS
jgi:hypothetical protein